MCNICELHLKRHHNICMATSYFVLSFRVKCLFQYLLHVKSFYCNCIFIPHIPRFSSLISFFQFITLTTYAHTQTHTYSTHTHTTLICSHVTDFLFVKKTHKQVTQQQKPLERRHGIHKCI